MINCWSQFFYISTILHTYYSSVHAGYISGKLVDLLFSTPHSNLVGTVITLVTEYICDRIFSRLTQRLATVRYKETTKLVLQFYFGFGFIVFSSTVSRCTPKKNKEMSEGIDDLKMGMTLFGVSTGGKHSSDTEVISIKILMTINVEDLYYRCRCIYRFDYSTETSSTI